MKNAKPKFFFICIVLLLLISAACFILWRSSPKAYLGYKPLPFSKDAWAGADAESRGHMLEDLLNRYKLQGLTEDKIISLLGKPDSVSRGQPDRKSLTFYYKLGYMGFNPKASFVFDYRLIIKFKDGIVQRTVVDD